MNPMTTTTATELDTRTYECAVILPIALTQKELNETIKNVEGAFAEKDAKQIAKCEWGKRGFAYKIKGYKEGLYLVFVYAVKPEYIREIDEVIHLEKNVLRHILISVPTDYKMVDWGAKLREWIDGREKEHEQKEEGRQEALKKKIVKKATKKPAVEKVEVETDEKKGNVNLEEKLGEIISDEDLNL